MVAAVKTDIPFHWTGHPVVTRTPSGNRLVTCPDGHLLVAVRRRDWRGSHWSEQCKDKAFTTRCPSIRIAYETP